MRKEYPLTAAENMHYQWIREYKTQQVSGLSIVAALQTELDFGLLKKCIQLEIQRYGCLRLRFTKPDKDGHIRQYLVKNDPRDIELKDLTGMTALFSMTKPDNTKAYEECAITDNKVILFITPQMSAAAGEGTAKITLTKNTRKESTSAFSFVIDAAAAPEDYWSDYEMAYYESVLSRIDEAALVAADVQEYAESAETSATEAAASASQARAIAMADVIACYPVGSVLITTTNTNPGTIIGRDSNVYPTSCVRGTIPEKSIWKDNGTIVAKK